MADSSIKPFKIDIPQDEVDRMFRKLADTRLPKEPIVPDAGEDYGPSLQWVKKLYNHYLDDYSWKESHAKITNWNHFTTQIENLNIHFIHERARVRPDTAIPLLLIHGWPGSFYEFQHIMEPLLNPSNENDLSFDLIIPSLPGFTWSQGPPRDWTLQDTARLYNDLMTRLGYQTYVVQAGDWGHYVLRELGTGKYPSCTAVHTNMCPGSPPPNVPWTPEETQALNRSKWFMGTPLHENQMGYAIEMRTRPQTIGLSLLDNPLGLLLWLGEKYLELADPSLGTSTLQSSQWKNDICTTVSLYFLTQPSFLTSTLCYYNNVRHEEYVAFGEREENWIKVPFGVSSFPYDAYPATRRGAERTGRLEWFRLWDRGGHFACLECPGEMVGDIREFFGRWH